MEISVRDRVALVTGASRGIGQAAAIALAEAGADVAVNYREDVAGAKETVAAIQKLGRKAIAYAASVENYDQDREMISAIVRDFGGLSILVNNAALPSTANRVADADPGEIETMLRVNTHAPFFLAQIAIPHMRREQRGDILMVTSNGTQNLRVGSAAYTMSKAAVETLSAILAKEEREHGIRSNVVGPGLTDTVLGRRAVKRLFGVDDIRELDAKLPFGHVCTPQEVAAAIVYLVSDANPYATGQKLYIDGGAPIRD